jgi:superfamily I DNA and/or RNA helicase
MNEDIMMLSNKLIYNGELMCDSEKVRNQKIEINI